MSSPWRCWRTKGPTQLQALFDIGSWVRLHWGVGDRWMLAGLGIPGPSRALPSPGTVLSVYQVLG